jgi:phosphotriesterase-related protein
MDRFGIEIYLEKVKRVDTIIKMCEMGYAGQIVLSHDAACHFGWADAAILKAVVPDWHFNHIPDDILPALKSGGVTDEMITQMTVDNPRKVFERQGSY